MKRRSEPVAIIGMGCRFPKADGPEALWQGLLAGLDAIGEIPGSRFPVDALFDPRPATPGRIMTRWGGFLEGVEEFDAAFFDISPREAAWLDPQQRLLLETTWEAIEAAGQAPDRLRGSNTGVFVGLWLNEYEARMFREPAQIDFYMTTGTGRYAASGRLSHFFGWHGPSVTIDCACSSSLVAVHLACQSLRAGESDVAVAGGANVLLEPSITLAYSQSRMMAPDGRCKFGDARANGYVRSDGAGVVVLKLLSRALADGDPVEALILGSAVNNDGGTSGSFGTPGPAGQEDLLRKACAAAGIRPADVDYVEAHGTGTRAGDPVELGALAAVLGRERPAGRPLVVGSIKTNIGHTEGAAGVAGLIKSALSLKHRAIPRSLHFETPNPDIPWDQLGIAIPKETLPWPSGGRSGIAGVSAFGIAGTNAHVILQEHAREDSAAIDVHSESSAGHEIVVMSGRSAEALRATAVRWEAWLGGEGPIPEISAVAATAALRRAHLEHRLALVAGDRGTLREGVRAYLAGEPYRGAATGEVEVGTSTKPVFVCPGQGSQWAGMGQRLLDREPAFRESIRRCDESIRRQEGWSLTEVLRAGPDAAWLDDIAVIQPALFAVQVALADLWRSWGIAPAAVVGHSMGEVAAACIAGALDLDSAIRVICLRSRLMKGVSGRGAMALVELSLRDAEAAVAGLEGRVSVAVSNSVRSTVLSGDPESIDDVLARLEAREVFCRRVKVDVASHSPQMDPIRKHLVEGLGELAPRPAAVPMVSTVTGDFIKGEELDGRYWGRNVREPVLFAKAVDRIAGQGFRLFIELSPHPILAPALKQQLDDGGKGYGVWPSFKRDEDERSVLLETLAGLYASGCSPDWSRLYAARRTTVALPHYPWQRERHWHEGMPLQTVACDAARGAEAGEPAATAADSEEARSSSAPRYELEWKPADGTSGGPGDGAGKRWLLLTECGEGRTDVGDALAARGARVVRAIRSATVRRPGPDTYSVAPGCEGDIARILEEATDGGCGAWAGVVSLWGIDGSKGGDPGRDVDRASAEGPESLLPVVKALAGSSRVSPGRLWIVTAGSQAVIDSDGLARPASAMLWGLGRVVGNEHPRLRCTTIDLSDCPDDVEMGTLAATLLADGHENQLAIRGGTRYVPRLVRKTPQARPLPEIARRVDSGGRAFRAEVRLPGTVEGVTLVPALRREPGAHEVEIEVVASGVNFLNVLSVLGACPGFAGGVGPLGGDCAGRVTRVGADVTTFKPGDDVYGIAFASMASHAAADERLLLRKPANLGFEDAATIPIAFVTAWHALRQLGRLQKGESILVHAASGGVGQAAIQIARLVGADVYGTAGNSEKRAWLVDQGLTFVADSRTTSFADGLLEATGGRGVDLVLNCLTGRAVERGLEVLAPGGRFIELAKSAIHAGGTLPLAPFRRNIAYHAVDLLQLVDECPAHVSRMLGEVGGLVESGQLTPLRRETYPVGRLADAFREMSETRHIGKIVVSMNGETRIDPGAFVEGSLPDGTYLVTGGAGALGLLTARALVKRGARSLVLVNRRAPGPEAEKAIGELRQAGAAIRTRQVDVANRSALEALLAEIDSEGPPLAGIVHAAGVLDDCVLLEMTPERFRRVVAPKAAGAWHLHELTRTRPLCLFALYSSIAALFGLPGQGNYAAGNAFLDALAAHRRRRGLAASSIAWGPWADVGLAAADHIRGERMATGGLPSLPPDEGLAALEDLLGESPCYAAVFHADWKRFREGYPEMADWPLLADIVSTKPGAKSADGPGAMRDAALGVEAGGPRRIFLESQIQAILGRVLRQAPSRIDLHKPFRSLGLDSLMGLEVRNWLGRGFGIDVPATLIWNYPTVAALSAEIARRAGVAIEKTPGGGAPPEDVPGERKSPEETSVERGMDLDGILAEVERMSDEETRRELEESRKGGGSK